MTDHERALELAAASFDFELSSADEDALTAHLEGCESCRATLEGLRADAVALGALARQDAPAGLRQRVLDAAQEPAEIASPDNKSGTPTLLRFPSRIPARYRHPAALVAAAAVIVAVVAGTLAWRAGPTNQGIAVIDPSTAPSGASGGPGSSGGPGGPGPTNPPGPSNPDLVTAWAPVAELTAVGARGGVVDVDSGFLLASVGGTPAAELARRVTVTPALTLTETVQADGQVLLTPAEPLTPGAVYQFTLAGDEGQTLDTWAFQARQPLHVVSTLPGNLATDVPVTTGIEVTFDQDGVVDAAAHMTIEPKVDGRFEQHDRVLAFVPDRLAPATIYTVTVTRGVVVEATGEQLEGDFRFQFETAAAGAGEPGAGETTFRFASDLFESATAERPTIFLWNYGDVSGDETAEPKAPQIVQLEVYRLPDQAAAIDAFRQLRTSPRWSQWNRADHVPTDGLSRVAGLDAHLEDANGTLWTRLPEALTAGWYLVEWPSTTDRAQAVLQVTDIAGYLVVSETKTLLWANDLGSGKPIAGAAVTAEGASLGQTGADGTFIVDTPPALLPDLAGDCATGCVPVVSVSAGGQAAFLPATGASNPDGKDTDFGFSGVELTGHPKYWRLFHTDRSKYRSTDTVNAWGMLRDRVSGTVPDAVTVRLVLSSDGTPATDAPIAQVEARPRSTGAFTGSLALRDVPEGSYRLQLVASGQVIAEEFIEVGRILKPAYRLEVVTGRRVYVEGDRIKVTASASFYDGTPVPGVPLRMSGVREASPTTDASGTAIVRGTAVFENEFERDDPEFQSVDVQPARAEEGDIEGATREFLVFPSMWTVSADSAIRGGRVRVSGAVNVVDRDRLETEIADGAPVWDLDPRGAAVKNRTVTATFTELIPVRTQTGTTYDFVEKRVVPIYNYEQRQRTVGTVKLTTDGRGRFAGSVPAPNTDHDYSIRISLTDPDGHVAERSTYASKGVVGFTDGPESPFVSLTDGGTAGAEVQFGIGDEIDVTMHEPNAAAAADGDRHLFYIAQAGLREATVESSSRYVTTFPAWGPPNMVIGAVRFTGSGYVAGFRFGASFRASDRAITIDLQPDKARYAPGDEVTLGITTRDPEGRALPATVVLRAIDEKLYSIGAAVSDDPLHELYASLSDGIRATYASHRNPQGRGSGADTGGGGGDAEFRDSLLFKAVDTGADGRASVTFRLSDDLTSWRVSATAVGAGLETGGASTQVPVGLPFFVDAAIAPEYLLADRPSIQLRAFGSALAAGERVTFSVDAESLGLHESGLHAAAFEAVTVPLPALKLGKHSVTITATTGSGSTARRYRVTRSFTVVASRLTRTRTTFAEPTARTGVQGGDGLTDIVVSDAGAGRELPVLLDLASAGTARLERGLAADVAAALIVERFGGPSDDPSAPTFDGTAYQTEDGGIAILPYAASNLETSALVALVAPDRFTGQSLNGYFQAIVASTTETRERRGFALAGLAGLGAPVLSEVRAAAADPDLTIRERLMLGLGAAALGDTETAHAIAASLAEAYGESVDGQARLRVGDDGTDISTATALMAMLMAATGDPVAPRYRAYVDANPSPEATYALETVGYIKRVLERLAPDPTSFAYEIGGKRTVVKLEPGDSLRLTLTKEQLASLSIEPVAGAIGITSSWREAVDAASFEKDPDVTIERKVIPSGILKSSDLVAVDLIVTFGPKAAAGCHRVTELAPSGLVPVGILRGFVDQETGEPLTGVTYPEEQAGQRVVFCAEAGPKPSVRLRYVARVITVGTYAWEPTIVESRSAADQAAIVPRGEVTIR